MNTTPTSTPDMTAVLGSDADCAERLAPYWQAADIHQGYPASTSTVVEVLRQGGGFDVSVELLEGWCRSGMVPNVSMRAGKFSWMPQNILTAAIQADTWRRWIPLDPRHIHKQSATEIAEAMAQAAGSTVFTDLSTFDVNAFIEVIANAADVNLRKTFATALKSKLRAVAPEVLDK